MAIKKSKKEAGETAGLDPIAILKAASKNGGIGDFVPSRPTISTGSIAIDLKLGGGAPKDRIVEVYGKSGSFKTNMVLSVFSNYAKQFPDDKRPFVIVDMERTITESFVKGFGISPDRIWVEKPKSAEEAMNFVSDVLNSGAAALVLVDSIDGLESEEDRNKNYGENSMMKLAKLLSEAMRDFSKASVDFDVGLYLINQVRTGSNGYQAIETTSGGNAIPYYASQRWRLKRSSKSNNPLAATLEVDIKKNKMYPTVAAETSIDFFPGKGIDIISDRMQAGLDLGLIVQGGAYYAVSMIPGGEEVAKLRGKNGFGEWLMSDSNLALFDKAIRIVAHDILTALIKEASQDTGSVLSVSRIEEGYDDT